MKKIKFLSSIMMAALAFVGVTSCSDDNDSNPTISGSPTEFVLNVPAAVDQYIQLSATNTVNLSWSQPDYGFNALATYKVQVGIKNLDGTIKWNTDKDGANSFLESTYTTCNVDLSGEEIAWAINNLDGVTTAAQYKDLGYRNVFFRVYSSLLDGQSKEVENTAIFSNEIRFTNMAAYNAVKEPGSIYIVGKPSGWKDPIPANMTFYQDYKLTETEIGNQIYEGTVTLDDGGADGAGNEFRFYTALDSWETNSMGCADDTGDTRCTKEFDASGKFEGKCAAGKGKWAFPNFAGKVKMMVNLKNNTVTFEKVAE